MLLSAFALAEAALAAPTPEAASERFHAAVAPLGASYLQTRLYRRPSARLTPATHWQAGGFVTRICRPDWPDRDAFRYICLDCNPLVGAVRQGPTSYRFSDFAPRERGFGAYWDALAEAEIGEALCTTSYGTGRRIASLHLGFPDPDIDPAIAAAVQMAGLMLTERLIRFADADDPDAAARPVLTARERDALTMVADGKTDWEIARILGVAQATARFHVDNARRKLGAVNRAQAVARLLVDGPF